VPLSDDDERELKVELMRADLALKRKQAFWETPRNIVLLVAAVAGAAGVLGFKLGQNSPPVQPIVIQVPPPPSR
jgi:hypothetical protein